MNHQEYTIGDIAAMTGISRDTLRFYEKKGILTVKKKENGYRYFTEDDLHRLIRIFFFRKLNFGLDTIEELSDSTPLCSDYQNRLQQQIHQELEALRRHKQTLCRLFSMKKVYGGLENRLDQICLKPFPPSRILCTLDSPSEGLSQWFALARQHPGLDMAYIYDCYQYQSGFSLAGCGTEDTKHPQAPSSYEANLTYEHSSILLYEDIRNLLKPDYDCSDCKITPNLSCIHVVTEADSCTLNPSLISAMRQWAGEQGLLPSPRIFVTSNLSRTQGDTAIYCQEIYIPVMSGK